MVQVIVGHYHCCVVVQVIPLLCCGTSNCWGLPLLCVVQVIVGHYHCCVVVKVIVGHYHCCVVAQVIVGD